MDDYTRKFNAAEDRDEQVHHVLTSVYEALKEKGYDPVNQIVGYILSEDPTYITNHNGARTLICKIDRDELLQILVKRYLDICPFCCFSQPFCQRFDTGPFLCYTGER